MRHLHRILAWAKSLMFIDPHLDPSAERYADFQKLVETAKKQRPLIEFHRVCYDGGGPNRTFPTRAEFENRFGKLDGQLKRDGLSAELFVWDDFHDRYLISNLIGILLPNGYDTSKDSGSMTTWTRLSPADRDDVQREFDPATKRHSLKWRIPLGIPTGG